MQRRTQNFCMPACVGPSSGIFRTKPAFFLSVDSFRAGVENMIDMPERTLNNLFGLMRQNERKLSKRARDHEFAALTQDEVSRLSNYRGIIRLKPIQWTRVQGPSPAEAHLEGYGWPARIAGILSPTGPALNPLSQARVKSGLRAGQTAGFHRSQAGTSAVDRQLAPKLSPTQVRCRAIRAH